jgi:hypothetical protein
MGGRNRGGLCGKNVDGFSTQLLVDFRSGIRQTHLVATWRLDTQKNIQFQENRETKSTFNFGLVTFGKRIEEIATLAILQLTSTVLVNSCCLD